MEYDEIMEENIVAANRKIPYSKNMAECLYWAWVVEQLYADLNDYDGTSHWRC